MSIEFTQTHTSLKTPLAAKVSRIILRGMLLFSVLAILLTAAIEYKLYKETAERNLDNLRENIKHRLAAVGETTVTFLDSEKHDAIFDFWDFQLEDFQHVKIHSCRFRNLINSKKLFTPSGWKMKKRGSQSLLS